MYLDKAYPNGIIYPKEAILPALEKVKRDIAQGNCSGEISPEREDLISLARVSHRVTEVWYNGEKNTIDGTIAILETPRGKMLTEMLKGFKTDFDSTFAIASRSIGNVNHETGVVENCELISFDIVLKGNSPLMKEIPKKTIEWKDLPNESIE